MDSLANLSDKHHASLRSNGALSKDPEGQIVAVARAALKLCPSGYSEHLTSLTALATCVQYRQQYGDTTVLDEAITLHKTALEFV